MYELVAERLREVAEDISRRLENCPTVVLYLGSHIRARLAMPDWIKSPELFTFAKPMQPLRLWRPTEEEAEHVQRKFQDLDGLTTLEAFELNLALDVRDVVGFEGWFQELGGVTGVHFDRRLHALTSEIEAIGRLIEVGKVEKLRSKNSQRPDYVADVPNFTVRLEAKTILRRAWAVSILQTMLRALVELKALPCANEVMAIAVDPDMPTGQFDDWIGRLSVEELVTAVAQASDGIEAELGPFRVVPRSEVARELGLHATYIPVWSLEDFSRDLKYREPTLEAFKFAAAGAWGQCEGYVVHGAQKPMLDMAWISAEATVGHPDLSPIQAQIREWLENEIWPHYPFRAIGCSFPDLLGGAWFVNPNLSEAIFH